MGVGGDSNISDSVLLSDEGGYAPLQHTQDSIFAYRRRKITNLDEEAYDCGYYYGG